MIGIYKIVSPTGRTYIGQSIDLERRILNYKKFKSSYKTQTKLKNSFEKYSLNKHKFNIIEICETKELNKKERYWQEYYNTLEKGLNCRLTKTSDKFGKLSTTTKKKISKANKVSHIGKKLTKLTKQKISKSLKGKFKKGKKVICLKTNKKWESVKQCSLDNPDIPYARLLSYLSGFRKNKTFFRYVN